MFYQYFIFYRLKIWCYICKQFSASPCNQIFWRILELLKRDIFCKKVRSKLIDFCLSSREGVVYFQLYHNKDDDHFINHTSYKWYEECDWSMDVFLTTTRTSGIYWSVDWCLTLVLAVFQPYRDVKNLIINLETRTSGRWRIWSDNYPLKLELPLFIDAPVPCQESELSCTCVVGVSILPRYLRSFDWILKLFRQSAMFCFSPSNQILLLPNCCSYGNTGGCFKVQGAWYYLHTTQTFPLHLKIECCIFHSSRATSGHSVGRVCIPIT